MAYRYLEAAIGKALGCGHISYFMRWYNYMYSQLWWLMAVTWVKNSLNTATSSVFCLLHVSSPTTMYLPTDESLFQVKVGPIQHCSEWMVSANLRSMYRVDTPQH